MDKYFKREIHLLIKKTIERIPEEWAMVKDSADYADERLFHFHDRIYYFFSVSVTVL